MRPKIRRKNIRKEFKKIKTLDKGDGLGAGAFNGGVYVVKRKSDGLICVDKRLRPEEATDPIAIKELTTVRKLEHANIAEYIDAFICVKTRTPSASLYMGYCDLGSIDDLIKKYRARPSRAYIPEPFIWHTLHSLMKALTYMICGASGNGPEVVPVRGWKRTLHKDIKPSNIFLKAPNPGGRYPSIVLGDFGLAVREDDRLRWGYRTPCGTTTFQPPEIPDHDLGGRADVWSAGATIQCMCRLDDGPVGPAPPGIPPRMWAQMPEARRPKRAGSKYSPELNAVEAMALTLNVRDRPHAPTLLLEVKRLYRQAMPVFKDLPPWAF
ncbi:MAG: hypothetical protein M1823_001242 [Watsoniomyces obsoletus]|nr:MAG: hypothetical protein M1823_001242 [Watsoniomyces obsoletus]